MTAPPVDLPIHTEEDLRAAWAKCRNEFWPGTFEETMQDPMRARMVDMAASGLAKKRAPSGMATGTLAVPVCRSHDAACSEVAASRRCANCPLRPPPREHHFKPPPGYVDRKRLAAGDRDED